jgi:hypothetical protein
MHLASSIDLNLDTTLFMVSPMAGETTEATETAAAEAPPATDPNKPVGSEPESASPSTAGGDAEPAAEVVPSPAEPAAPESVASRLVKEHMIPGGGFTSFLTPPAAAPTMLERIEAVERRLAAIEAKLTPIEEFWART